MYCKFVLPNWNVWSYVKASQKMACDQQLLCALLLNYVCNVANLIPEILKGIYSLMSAPAWPLLLHGT